ncbi:MAG: phospholipid carrier-dependent glycosyltransferase [Victivallales bacterium]|jgi:4-amino-4-deoxy-L-arabinose transferase-like glycosyltransferase|nr:phospholipid carrier-dependent glycosyltransferase [Victivallales bacterium]
MNILIQLTYQKAFTIVLLFSLLITLAGLNVRELCSGDETRVAGIAAEMFIEKDYLVPHLNGEPFLEYPPLYYWAISLSYRIFGINDFAAKLPSALAAIGCGILIFAFAKAMKFHPWNALGSTIILMSSAQFFEKSRECMVDMMLAFFILMAIYHCCPIKKSV